MKRITSYLALLLTIMFMVGCNEENATITEGETDSQEVTTVNTDENSIKRRDYQYGS